MSTYLKGSSWNPRSSARFENALPAACSMDRGMAALLCTSVSELAKLAVGVEKSYPSR
eukprot:CAMPEP_0179220858 /NCGR_PEP_ID=MMETSP0797-20121207/5863_1 /TAXON_ID=47934 /ORGANISM="Dinophysis acuminata, Strain DAEP01" /LENGTH=57 /DNA_ID=CAMNT_0020927565 /DNA_START=29 /DNA_END=199 /DNA_ORIENTATION=+